MFTDIDHKHPDVRQDIFNWVRWLSTQLKLGGFRFDGVKENAVTFVRNHDIVSAFSLVPEIPSAHRYHSNPAGHSMAGQWK